MLRNKKCVPQVLLLAATLAIASAAFAPSCEECNQAAAGLLVVTIKAKTAKFKLFSRQSNFNSNSLLQTRLTSAESIAEQTGILISQVCPQAAEPVACEAVRALSISSFSFLIFT